MTRKLYLLLFVSLTMTIVSSAQNLPFHVEKLEDRPASGASDNYFQLIQKVFPAMGFNEETDNPTINRSVDLRKLSGEEYTLYESPFEIESVIGWWFETDGAKHLALLMEISKRFAKTGGASDLKYALAVFRYVERNEKYAVKQDETKIRIVRKFELVEAVDPQTDRFVEFPEAFPLVDESPKSQIFWILNHHWNAGESFRDYKAIRVESKNRLSLAIENLPGAYVSTDCSNDREQSFYIEQVNRPRKGYLPYEFNLRTLIWTKNECESKQETSYPVEELHVYQARWETTKNKRRVLRLRSVRFSRKRVKVWRNKGCYQLAN